MEGTEEKRRGWGEGRLGFALMPNKAYWLCGDFLFLGFYNPEPTNSMANIIKLCALVIIVYY